MERRITFFSPTLGITLRRGPDGFVRVVDVMPTTADGTIQRQGDIAVGDVLCEIQGIANLRNMPLTPQGWGRVVRQLKAAAATTTTTPRPLVLYVVAASENDKNLPGCDGGGVSDHGDQCDSNNSKYIPHRRHMHSRGGPSSIVSPVGDRRKQRQSRSLTPPKGIAFGRQHVNSNTSNRNDKGNSSSNNNDGATVSSIGAAQYYFQMGTACLIPSELRPMNHHHASRYVEQKYQEPNRHGFLGGDHTVEYAQIECRDMKQMLMVSQISMDEELMELQQQEDESVKRYNDEYDNDDVLSSIRPMRNLYREEHKDDDPRKRGPQPNKPPRYNPQAVPRRRRRIRRLSV